MQMGKRGSSIFSQCSMACSLAGNSGGEGAAGKVFNSPNGTQVSPCILPWHRHALFLVAHQLQKRQSWFFHACISERSLGPSTQQALNQCLQG